jgi:hypothetical protein
MSTLRISMRTTDRNLDKSPIDRAITALAVCAATEERSGGLPGGPILDLTFMLSSKDDRPPFDGMRMGGYTAEERTLFFEAAVPEAMGFSEQAPQYVAAVLQDVIDNAADYFQELNVDFDTERWQQALIPLVASVTGTPTTH